MAAEAAGEKARLLQPTQPEQDDPNIVAALAAASGARPLPRACPTVSRRSKRTRSEPLAGGKVPILAVTVGLPQEEIGGIMMGT